MVGQAFLTGAFLTGLAAAPKKPLAISSNSLILKQHLLLQNVHFLHHTATPWNTKVSKPAFVREYSSTMEAFYLARDISR